MDDTTPITSPDGRRNPPKPTQENDNMISPPDTTKRGRGRPKLYEQKRSRILKSSVTEAERLTVIERAARHGMGVSDYIRHRALGLRIVKSSA